MFVRGVEFGGEFWVRYPLSPPTAELSLRASLSAGRFAPAGGASPSPTRENGVRARSGVRWRILGALPPLTAYGGALPEGEPYDGSLRSGSEKRNLLEKTARFCPENPYLEIFQKIQIAIFSQNPLFRKFSKNPNSEISAIFAPKKEKSYNFIKKGE